ncbi:MAG: DinB family protein [Bacteroidetes bacterium]|jgi:hypothetical protein|nr:DinB family protein [Bacteroidota bacterium]
MNSKIAKEIEILESDLDSLIKELQKYDDEILNRKPENSWSVLQVLHHLMLAEQGSLKYVKKKLSYNPELKKVNWQTKIRTLMLNFYVWSPLKFSAPKIISGDNLPTESNLNTIKEQYPMVRRDIKDFFETVPDSLLEKEIFKHALAGRLSLIGMIVFFKGHFKRHKNQIYRILKSIE